MNLLEQEWPVFALIEDVIFAQFAAKWQGVPPVTSADSYFDILACRVIEKDLSRHFLVVAELQFL